MDYKTDDGVMLSELIEQLIRYKRDYGDTKIVGVRNCDRSSTMHMILTTSMNHGATTINILK